MDTSQLFILAFNALSERKTRTILTILMVVVGSSLMIVLNGLSAGQTKFVDDQLNQLADNVMTVTPGQRSFRDVDTTTSIVFNSVVVSKINSLLYVKEVVPQYSATVTLQSQTNVLRTSILAMNPDNVYVTVPNLEMEEGSVIKPNDPSAILVGYSVANPDGSTVPIVMLGQTVKLTFTYIGSDGQQTQDTRIFVVTGILKQSGDNSLDRSVIVNESVGNSFLRKSGKFDRLLVAVESPSLTSVVEQEIRDHYGATIGISSLQSRLQFRQQFTEGINSFIMSVGVIALVVGAVGIITTLYTSVTERIREIGTMKAIGAQSTTILLLFLIEALLIGIFGATVGLVTGIVA